jgi:BirA family transcriptional regulator, biotin operon repressor / biotin---[acetyl-CoA-carboxylase] ligase
LNVFKLELNTLQNNIFSSLFVGQFFFTLKEVDSTNNFLKQMLSNSTPVMNGTVIMAENQYAGRGQQQKSWHTEPGKNLTFSILLETDFLPIKSQFDLTIITSMAVFEALYPLLGENLKIKWPNDIYYGDFKLGGILIENIIQGNQIKKSVIGIGLNINQVDFPEWLPNPTSVKQILRKDYDLKTLLSDICACIETGYLGLKNGDGFAVRKSYLNRLYWLNELKPFKANDELFEGWIKTVRENGLLVVENNKGEELEFSFKEIQFLNGK